jgi:hypothetical protein
MYQTGVLRLYMEVNNQGGFLFMASINAWRLPLAVGLTLMCCQVGVASAGAAPVAEPPATPPAAAQGAAPAGIPAARPVGEAVLSRAKATAQILPQAVSYYEKTFGVSQSVATERLASQLMGQGIQSTFQARYGNAIAGVSFDNVTGNWVVDATASVPASGVAAVFAKTGLSGAYRVARVGYTQSEVNGASSQLTARLQSLIKRGVVSVTSGGAKVTITVSAKASPADLAAVAAAERAAAASSAVPITQSSTPGDLAAQATSVQCSGIYCNTLVAGDTYSGTGGSCTMSWYGSLQLGSTTQPLMLTAGHCTLDLGGAGSTVSTYDLSANVSFGHQYLGAFNGGGDWGYIYTNNPPPTGLDPGLGRPYGGYFNWGSGTLVRLAYYYNSGVPSSGTVICHNGEGSVTFLGNGTQCGTAGGLTSVNVNRNGTTTTLGNMLQVNSTEECYGDSGGPWDLSSSATAVAIQSSASIPAGSNCGTTAWATPVSTPIQAYAPWNITLYGG